MQNIKNFTRYTPSPKVLLADFEATGKIYKYLMSEDGHDWYECQKLFADDTVKIMYDSEGIIRSVVDAPVPERGGTFAASMLFPLNMSVAEVTQEKYPDGCDIDGTWKFDGEQVYQDADIVDGKTLTAITAKRNSLAAKAATAIAMINASSAVGNPREGDSDKLQLLQEYLDQLRDVAPANPVWPPVPSLIL